MDLTKHLTDRRFIYVSTVDEIFEIDSIEKFERACEHTIDNNFLIWFIARTVIEKIFGPTLNSPRKMYTQEKSFKEISNLVDNVYKEHL